MPVSISQFAQNLTVETAFTVLARARELAAGGKEIIELEIGDSPFPSTKAAKQAGLDAIAGDRSHYCPSIGLPEMRQAASDFVNREYGTATTAENIVVGPGAKIFELLFCETFLDPGDGVLVFSPYFPTYIPNITRRNARVWLSDLKQENEFRPNLDDVERFLATDSRPKAIFINSPHNPTGGIATEEDLKGLADLVRGRNVAVFSDEPYDRMVWRGRHHTITALPGMLDQCVAAYTFSKSYSMSGWRLGFAVAPAETARMFGDLINTCLSCTPPLVQMAGVAAMSDDNDESRQSMAKFREKVEILVAGLNEIEDVKCLDPGGTFYVFPSVEPICRRLGITSHGLAMYLLEGADDQFGVACLGGECFGEAGRGFLRFSCAEPNDRLRQALEFLPMAFSRTDRVERFLEQRPEYRI
ncbi:MAG: aminotransferase class I/II-fold pyridoxal phosphate-dependent enzyme [Candidatus Nealsonbacteria bacterium]|nr:aminotransferase class I/II-fold pyridoxal phosphate-dependent enzyme [Candidatus Nealsonbacteria bacterium]